MSDIADWFNGLPLFTRWWLSLTLGFSLAGRIGLLDARYMILLMKPFIYNFEIWRPITATFFYPITPQTGFHFLINCYFLYNYSLRLERSEFAGRSADYFYMLLINWFVVVVTAIFIGLPFLMDALVLSVLYVWCQFNREMIVSFWFGTTFRAMYLPWVLFGFNFIIAGGGVSELIGIIAGHIYCFLKFILPSRTGTTSWIDTPQFLLQYFPNSRGGFGVPPAQPAAAAAPEPTRRGHNWGRGRVLGTVD